MRGFTNGGWGEASRILHRFERQSILPGGEKAALRPVLYNSWEATEFNVSEAGQIALAEKAASWASSASSSMTDGSANAKMTTQAWVTGM